MMLVSFDINDEMKKYTHCKDCIHKNKKYNDKSPCWSCKQSMPTNFEEE